MKKLNFSAVLMIAGLVLVSGCATMKGETTGEYIDDSNITAQVNAIIVKDPDAKFLKIETTTIQGDVVLQGFVKNRDTETRIMMQIMEIGGVKSVESLLKLEKINKPFSGGK